MGTSGGSRWRTLLSRRRPGSLGRTGDGATPFELWPVGEVMAQRYEVREVIHSGGMGIVYRVLHREWGVELAVKAPRPELLASEAHIRDFEAEAQTWVGLGVHPNTVSCAYVRRMSGVPHVFAEWVSGGSLAEAVRDRRLYRGAPPQVLGRLLDIAIQVARGIEHAHDRGLIHQDVKPANVLLAPDGTAKVTDFGLARARIAMAERPVGQPNTTMVAGFSGMTRAYCSPEQAAAAVDATITLTRATDVWSWAITVWEMFAGGPPCPFGRTADVRFESFVNRGATPEPGIPAMPPCVAELLRRCLAPDPAVRIRRMGVVADELTELYRELIGTPYPRPRPNAAELLADSLSNQALSMLDLDRAGDAERLWEQALAADRNHLHTVFNYGLHLWRTGKVTDLQLLDRLASARADHPDGPDTDYLLGVVQLERGDIGAARSLLTAAARRDPHDPAVAAAAAVAVAQPDDPAPMIWRGDTGAVVSVALSADGSIGVSGGDGMIRVWDLRAGRCLHELPVEPDHARPVDHIAVAVSGNGSRVVAHDRGLIQVWDAETGRCLHRIEGVPAHEHPGRRASVAVSTDGALAVTGGVSSAEVLAWDLVAGRLLRTLRAARHFSSHRNFPHGVGLSRDGRLAMAFDGENAEIRVWEVATGRLLRTLEYHVCAVLNQYSGLVLSRRQDDATWPRLGAEQVLWRLGTGRVERTVRLDPAWCTPHLGPIELGSAVSSDGRFALGVTRDVRGWVRIWDLETGCCRRTYDFAALSDLALSADDTTVIAAGRDGSMCVWRLSPGGPAAPWSYVRPRDVFELTARAESVHDIVAQVDQLLADRRWSDAAERLRAAREIPGYERHPDLRDRWWRAAAGGERGELRSAWVSLVLDGWVGPDRVATTTADRLGLIGAENGSVRVLELATGRRVRTFAHRPGCLEHPAFSDSGHRVVLFGGGDQIVRIWDVHTGELVRQLPGHGEVLRSVVLTDDDRTAVVIGHATVSVWDLATGACRHTLRGLTYHPLSASVSGDGSLAVLADPGSGVLQFWNLLDGCRLSRIDVVAHRPAGDAGARAIATRGRWAFTSFDDCSIQMWDMATGENLRRFEGHTRAVTALAVSSDGSVLVSGGADGAVRAWDVATGAGLHEFLGHEAGVTALALARDTRIAVSGSDDSTVRVWDLARGGCPRTLDALGDSSLSVAVTANGRFVLSTGLEGRARVWELDWDHRFSG